MKKVLGTMNPADVLTKHVDRTTLERHLLSMGIIEDFGRAASAPPLTMPIKNRLLLFFV